MMDRRNNRSSSDSIVEIVDINSNDSIIEIGSDTSNSNIDLSYVIDAATSEDIEDLRIIFKSDKVLDCSTENAQGRKLKRKHTDPIEENGNKRPNSAGSIRSNQEQTSNKACQIIESYTIEESSNATAEENGNQRPNSADSIRSSQEQTSNVVNETMETCTIEKSYNKNNESSIEENSSNVDVTNGNVEGVNNVAASSIRPSQEQSSNIPDETMETCTIRECNNENDDSPIQDNRSNVLDVTNENIEGVNNVAAVSNRPSQEQSSNIPDETMETCTIRESNNDIDESPIQDNSSNDVNVTNENVEGVNNVAAVSIRPSQEQSPNVPDETMETCTIRESNNDNDESPIQDNSSNVVDVTNKNNEDVIDEAAGSFRDMTTIQNKPSYSYRTEDYISIAESVQSENQNNEEDVNDEVAGSSMTRSPNRPFSNTTEVEEIVQADDVISVSSSGDESLPSIKCESESELSINCSSIKSETSDEEMSSFNTQLETENTRKRYYDYDLSRLNWLRPLDNLSSPPHLQIVIIDRFYKDWCIPRGKWLMIEKILLEDLHDEMLRRNDASIGLFDGAKWIRGIKVIGCHNKNSLNYISRFVLNINKLWPETKLDIIPINKLSRQLVEVFIPPPVMKNKAILSMIKLQNPPICCDDWEILKSREKPSGGRFLCISINLQSLEYLQRTRGEVKFGINRVWFKKCH